MKAFLTGSKVYGSFWSSNSDVDLVVWMNAEDAEILQRQTHTYGGDGVDNYAVCSYRFGSLNLLVVTSEKIYEAWKKGTAECKKANPKTKAEAIAIMAKAGVPQWKRK